MFGAIIDDGKRESWGTVRDHIHGRRIEYVTEMCGDCYIYVEGGLCLICVRGGLVVHNGKEKLAILDYGEARDTLSECDPLDFEEQV